MQGLDTYSLQARYLPVLIVVLPVLVLLGGTLLSGRRADLVAGACATVFAAIAGQLGRDRGKRIEPNLWESWGGSPTRQRLQFRTGRASATTERLHRRIRNVLSDQLPTEAEELADPRAADERYDDAVSRLRGLTRDKRRFGLLFRENVNYGLRRNLLGLKPIGIAVSGGALLAAALLIGLASGSVAHRAALYAPAACIALVMLAFWVAAVSDSWARIPAEAYAERLFESVDVLSKETNDGL